MLPCVLFFTLQIGWADRHIEADGLAAKVSIDGTDCPTVEHKPFNPKRFSHKFKGAGLRCEVGILVATGFVVHIDGPFRASVSDLAIAKRCSHHTLDDGEHRVADGGHEGCNNPSLPFDDVPPKEREEHKEIRAWHENANDMLKKWAILRHKFCHCEPLHGTAFCAAAVLTQMELCTI